MPTHLGKGIWHGGGSQGQGWISTESGAVAAAYSSAARFAEGAGTSPEELMAASHAGCYAMALSLLLNRAGYTVERVEACAHVTVAPIEGVPTITHSALSTTGRVHGLDPLEFARLAERAKGSCPVSRALAGVELTVVAQLVP
jgi:osmotically inducible protein OsmC